MSFPRYPKYKDSGIEWIGEIPEHWVPMLLKRLASLITGITPPTNEQENYSENDEYPWIRPEDLDDRGRPTHASKYLSVKGWRFVRSIPANSSLVCCIGTIGKLGYSETEVSTNQQITAVSFKGMPRYHYYALYAAKVEMELASTGNVLRILNSERLGKIALPTPALEEGKKISDFLDRETEKIDALVAEQEKLITLLKEKRQAVISHAVTKGLNPNAKMKDSGIEWLGNVPEHWKSASLRWLSSIYAGGTPDKNNLDYWTDGTIPWINSGAVNQSLVIEPSTYITEEAFNNSSAKWIPSGALVMALAGQGKTKGMVAQLAISTTCNQSMAAIIPTEEVNPRFLFWWLTSNYQNIRNLAGGDLRDGLNLELIGDIPCPLIPLEEQFAISEFLDNEVTQFLALVIEAERAIELLKERRSALISAAVTGKIDVRNAVIPTKAGMTAEEVAI